MRVYRMLLTVAVVCTPAACAAQKPHPLVRALETWRGGPLIAVAPRQTRLAEGWQEPPPDASLTDHAAAYSRKLVRVGTVTALVPTEMAVINMRPGLPDLFKGMSPGSKLAILEGSLTDAQWEKLGSAQGLGEDDLKQDQFVLFDSLLSSPFRLQGVAVTKGRPGPDGRSITLTAAQRERVRLRLVKRLSAGFEQADRPGWYVSFDGGRMRRDGERYFRVDRQSGIRAFGADLLRFEDNRAKPSDLRYDSDALSRQVSLRPEAGTDQPLMLDGLVSRIAAATGLELYTDPRLDFLPIWSYRDSARAGDILKALCLAVCGTFRKVGPAYVLTNDLLGIGTRRALLHEWEQSARQMEQSLVTRAAARFGRSSVEKHVHFGDEDAPLSRERLGSLPVEWNGWAMGNNAVDVPASELQGSWRDWAEAQAEMGSNDPYLKSRAAYEQRSSALRNDRVRLGVKLGLEYVIPGVGVADGAIGQDEQFGGMTYGYPPKGASPVMASAPTAWPADLSRRVLQVSVATTDEAVAAVRAAAGRGFTALWIETPSGDVIKAAVEAASAKIAILPLVRPLLRPDPAGTLADRNITLETLADYQQRVPAPPVGSGYTPVRDRLAHAGSWVRVDVPDGRALARRTPLETAAIRGIAAVVLSSTAPPGYENDGKSGFSFGDSYEFGYSTDLRLAMLRKSHVDPVDLPRQGSEAAMATRLPFFNDMQFAGLSGNPDGPWQAMRYAVNDTFTRDLLSQLRDRAPAVPVWMDCRGPEYEEGWFALQDQPGEIAGRWMPQVSRADRGVALRRAGVHALVRFGHVRWLFDPATPRDARGEPKDDPAAFATAAQRAAQDAAGVWEGIVVDLSDLPAEKAVRLLSGFPSTPNSPLSNR